MNPFSILLLAASLAVSTTTINAEQAQRGEKEPTTADVMASIGGVAGNRTLVLHFEIIADGRPVGFARSSLSEVGPRGSDSYKYEMEMVLSLGQGAHIEGSVKATLSAWLEPLEVEARRELVAPNGKRKSTLHRAEFQNKELLLTSEEDGNPGTQQSVPRPESPFVFALEFLVQRIDLERFPSFALREFDVHDRTVKTQHFRVESGPGGTRRLVSRKDDGSIGYVFQVDATGRLVSWVEPPLPIVSKRCSHQRFEELRRLVQGR